MDRRAPQRHELNLLPMMNLVSLLIPLLLMGTQLVALSTIRVTQPLVGPGVPGEKLDVTVRIEPEGFFVEGAEEVLGDASFAIPCPSACEATGDWPHEALTEALVRIKDSAPATRAITLVPDARVTYQVMVRTLDASRAHRVGGEHRELFPEASIQAR
jgi:hypothetical protein